MKPSNALKMVHFITKETRSRVRQSQVCYLCTTHSSALNNAPTTLVSLLLTHKTHSPVISHAQDALTNPQETSVPQGHM